MDFRLESDLKKSLFYDEQKMILSFNVEADNDVLFINILNLKLDIDQKFGQRS